MRSIIVLACLVMCGTSVAVAECIDTDGDGYGNPASVDCPFPALDCNDGSLSAFPGAVESCDGFDNDCDGQSDNHPECDRTCDPPESLGAERVISSSAGFSPGSWPRTAWNGGGFATVWSGHPSGGNDAVFFALSDASGARTSAEIPVSSSSGFAKDPAIAFTGSAYGVAWADSRDGELEIYFTRIGASGEKQLADVPLTRDEEISAWPDIAWDGRQFGVVWSGEQGGMYFTTLDLDGHLTSPVATVSTSIAWPNRAAIVWTGSEYAVVWSGYEDGDAQVFFQRISATGGLLGPPVGVTTNTSSTAANPRLAWSGTRFGVVWYDDRVGGHRVHIALLDPAGTRQGADAAPLGRRVDQPGHRVERGGVRGRVERCPRRGQPAGLLPAGRHRRTAGFPCDPRLVGRGDVRQRGHRLDRRPIRGGVARAERGLARPDEHRRVRRRRRRSTMTATSFPRRLRRTGQRLRRLPGASDNCPTVRNESQHDADQDLQGDECDLDDGLVLFLEISDPRVRWQDDAAYSSFNLYRGSLAVLRASGEYTQEPGSNPYAARFCGLTATDQDDVLSPATGEAFYWLVAGVGAAGEEPLGDGAGVDRPNDHPCP